MIMYGAFIIVENNIVWTYLGNSRIVCQNKLLDKLEQMDSKTVVLPEINGKALSFKTPIFCQLVKYNVQETEE